jgi:putative oxidoreductase
MNQWMDCYAPLIGRILMGGVFLWNGVMKVLGFTYIVDFITTAGLPYPILAAVVAISIEVLCGIAVVMDFFTRTSAVVLAIYTIIVTFIFHGNITDELQMTLFLKNIAIVGGLFYVTALGPGRWSMKSRRYSTL